MSQESRRLQEARDGKQAWKKWGPYLSERQWGTVREDYSENGNAWDHFSHDHARSSFADVERSTPRPHLPIANLHDERALAIARNDEVRLTAVEMQQPHIRGVPHVHQGLRSELDSRTVR